MRIFGQIFAKYALKIFKGNLLCYISIKRGFDKDCKSYSENMLGKLFDSESWKNKKNEENNVIIPNIDIGEF